MTNISFTCDNEALALSSMSLGIIHSKNISRMIFRHALPLCLLASSSLLSTFAFVWPMKVSPAQSRISPLLAAISRSEKENMESSLYTISRATFFQSMFVAAASTNVVNAFDGGVGGLGKTKPSTGVAFFEETSLPIQNAQGIVTAEIQSVSGKKPILVEFSTPWPLLPTTSGLEARDIRSTESAFVQVVPVAKNWQDRKVFRDLLIDSVLASQGKYGAYGTPTDIKVKPLAAKESLVFSVTFTSYTPGMRESERQLWIRPIQVDDTLVLLVVGTTRARFASQETTVSKIVDSFLAVAAPESKLRTK